jgi:hypothetical protein
MNLIFKSIKIVNFGCFSETHTFKFERSSGLYFIRGRNLVEVSLTGNGWKRRSLMPYSGFSLVKPYEICDLDQLSNRGTHALLC